jgi:undecaprenyl-diphosphatase
VSWWFAMLLGLVQGLTEFLPISSTAHLRIVPALLGQPDPGAAFSAVIQLGTLVAVLAYFARDLFFDMPRALARAPRSAEARMAGYMVVATIPIAVAGVALKDHIRSDFRSLYVVAGALAVVAVIMHLADRRGGGRRLLATATLVDAVIIGAAQALALVPGVSRSGATIAAALVVGFARTDAARFSFLIGIPAIAAAGLYEFRGAVGELGEGGLVPIALGTIVAAVSGYASIAWLLRFLGRHTFTPFVLYRLTLALVLLALVAKGVLRAT